MKKYRKRPITHIIHRKKLAPKINHQATFKHLIDVGHKEISLECEYCHKIVKKELIELVVSASLKFNNKIEEIKNKYQCEECECINHLILDK